MKKQLRKWSSQEDEIIKKNYNLLKFKEIEKLLPSRTLHSIEHRAYCLHLTKNRPKSPNWTKEEDNLIKKFYGKLGDKMQGLTKRTRQAVRMRAYLLKVKKINSKRAPARLQR